MAVVALAFAAGIVLADYVPIVGCLLLVVTLLLLELLLVPARYRATVVLVSLIALSGAFRYACDRSIAMNDVSRFGRGASAFEGVVASDAGGDTDSRRMTFRVSRVRAAGRWRDASGDVMLSLRPGDGCAIPSLAYGDRARIAARPYVPLEPTNPGQFSWKGYLARHGIYACASVSDPGQIEILHKSRAHSILGAALVAKHYLVSAISKIHPVREASVMSGVVLGTYAYLDDDTLQQFTRTGTLHVLAASGYNCFILLFFASPILKLFRVFPRHKGVIMVFLIAAYMLMVGPMPSLVRAGVMSSLMLLASPLRRIPDYTNLFYVAALVLLILNPSNLFDIGFQLSFLAVWSLIMVVPLIEAVMARTNLSELQGQKRWRGSSHRFFRFVQYARGKLVGIFASTLVGTIAVGLVTAPVVAYYFHYFSLTSLPANLAVAFLEPLVFFDSFASSVTALVPHCSGFIGLLGTLSTRAMLGIVGYFGSMRHSSIAMQSPGVLGIIGYYLVLLSLAGYARSRFAER